MRQNLVAQFIQVLKCWLWDMQSGVVVEKNWALSVDHCQLQALQFLVHVINLLSIPLRCNGFAGIQKAVVNQTSSSPLWRCAARVDQLLWGGVLCEEASAANSGNPDEKRHQ